METNTQIQKRKTSKKITKSQILMFFLLLIFGIVSSLQFRAIEDNRKKIEAAKIDYKYYADMLAAEHKYTDTTTVKLEELKNKKNELLEKLLLESGDTEILDALQKVYKIAGFTDVTGKGIVVTLDDQSIEDPSFPATTSAIHDLDIRQVVDIMRSCGAVAISVNGERVVSTSELTCNGPTVQINKKKFPVPYKIAAIGDVVLMKTMIEKDSYIVNRILSNIQFSIKIDEELTVKAFSEYDKIDQYIDSFKEVSTK